MKTLDRLQQFFAYDQWANGEVLSSFRSAGTPPSRSLRLLAHVLGTEYVWFSRIKAQKSPLAVWPELDLAQCDRHTRELGHIWSNYLDELDEAACERNVVYQNTKGETWSNSVEDILTHVIMHSAYHRGQIAMDMRAAGHTPAYTDFIHGLRQKMLK
ncbi:MAG TPA: DinB family protein [Terriglobales bacterium]|nr:DinB family protein [Terriglobales bacterium]